jgi:hypothetical protein
LHRKTSLHLLVEKLGLKYCTAVLEGKAKLGEGYGSDWNKGEAWGTRNKSYRTCQKEVKEYQEK